MKHYYRKTRTGKEITFTYSEEDAAFVQSFKGSFNYDREGYVIYGKKKRRFHREIMNPPRDLVVDHIDRDILNCTRENLRVTTRGVNSFNRKRHGNSGLEYPGVRPRSLKDGKIVYDVECYIGNERISHKVFHSFEEAKAFKQAHEITYYGNTYDDIDKRS